MNAPTQKVITQVLKMGRSPSAFSVVTSMIVGLTMIACGEQQPSATTTSPSPPISTAVSASSDPSISWNDILRAVELSFPASDRPAIIQSLSSIVNPLNATPAYAQAAVLVLGYQDKEAISQLVYAASGDARDVLIYLDQPESYQSGLTKQEIVRRYRELQLPVPEHLEEESSSPQPTTLISSPGSIPVASQAQYQEALGNCTVGTLYLPEPTGLIPNSMIHMVILGREQNHCRVEYFIQAATASDVPPKYLTCQYSPSTINLLVNSPNNNEALNRATAQECQSLPQ
jgi:hypothetical protein